ncbi:MAG: hypothetical protein RDU20_11815 [Desulfomonilaceae bacterium]|nr:hypothetical protein [Desulfomonilaceae bacterium]
MEKLKALTAAAAALTCMIFVSFVAEAAAQSTQNTSGRGLASMESAARAQRYLLVFFFKSDDPQTRALRDVFNRAAGRVSNRADAIAVMTTDPAEQGIVTKFKLDAAPMPIVLAIAPNGALTGGFHTSFTEDQLIGALVGPVEAQVLGSLQQGKLVVLCAQNGKTRFNNEAMQGVTAFKADQRFSAATEVVTLDPAQADAQPLLTKLGAGLPLNQAATFLLAPPGSVIGQFQGPVDKNQLVAALTSAVSGCGAGCGAGGCSVQ